MTAELPTEPSAPSQEPTPALPGDPPAIRIEQHSLVSRPADHSPPPRLSIAHLYLWVTCSAVDLAIVRTLIRDEPGMIGLAIVALHAAGMGIVWSGLLIFLVRRLRGVRWPIEPGEWLIAALGVRMTCDLLLGQVAPRLFAAPQAVLLAATACALILPSLVARLDGLWRGVFYGLLATQLVPLVLMLVSVWRQQPVGRYQHFYEDSRWLGAILTITLLAIAVQRDRSRQIPRTWLHWAGVSMWFLVLGPIWLFVR